ncbi:MAG: OsmC family protein [Ginsengibacter sp.]
MTHVSATIGPENYCTILSANAHTLLADEPVLNGGQGKGFSPHELMAASLAACTVITLKMYADRKGWDIHGIKVEVSIQIEEHKFASFQCMIEVPLHITEPQRNRMLEISRNCPLHQILVNTSKITSSIK